MAINFHPLFRELAERHFRVSVELKNSIHITGTLEFIDANLNLHLTAIETQVPQLQGTNRCFVRGSTIKFITMGSEELNDELLEDLLRRDGIAEASGT